MKNAKPVSLIAGILFPTILALPVSSAVPEPADQGPFVAAPASSAPAPDALADPAAAHAAHMAAADVEPAPPPAPIPDAESGTIIPGLPFEQPPIIRSRRGVLRVALTSQATPVRISGKLVNARVYSASAYGQDYPPSFAPPILIVDPGDNLQVTLRNQLGEPTNLHTHGFFVSPAGNQDNVFVNLPTARPFFYNYTLPGDLSPGLYWYHPHFHPLVEEQVFGGLSGLIYVRGLEKLLPAQLSRIKQRFFEIKDFQFNKDNTIPAVNINSDSPTNRTVNGLVQPVLTMATGETQLWHLGNIGADIWYTLQMPGLQFTVVAEDGNPLDRAWTTDQLLMPPAKRFDVLVQTRKAGSYRLLTRKMNTGPAGDDYPGALMATLDVTGADKEPVALPTAIKPFDDLAKATVVRQRQFLLSENQNTNKFFINHRVFGPNHVDATPKTGTVEEWVFKNSSRELHPIHIHVNDAQVMSINGKTQNARSWVDTIPIPYATRGADGKLVPGEVVMRFKFRRFIGSYVFHCHILAHEDNGMMSIINVTTPGSD
jgi:suppressor of ftsI